MSVPWSNSTQHRPRLKRKSQNGLFSFKEAQMTFCLLSSVLSPVETVSGGEASIADYKMAS